MGVLDGFDDMHFSEQMQVLEDIEKKKNEKAIPELFEICHEKKDNDQVQFMAMNTLKTLLAEDEEKTVEGINSESVYIRQICLEIVEQCDFESAIPVILDKIKATKALDQYYHLLTAITKMKTPETLELFRNNIIHEDVLVEALSREALGNFKDEDSVDMIIKIITDCSEKEDHKRCEIGAATAVLSLGKIASDKALSFLVQIIHAPNPTGRRFVHMALARAGTVSIPFIGPVFKADDVDKKIMAANVLGEIDDKESINILINAIDSGAANEPNVLCAIYDSLGKLPSMKSMVCLIDGLSDADGYILAAVITALEPQTYPGVVEKISEIINKNDEHSQLIINTIAATQSLSIFQKLYKNEEIASEIINAVIASRNEDIMNAFTEELEKSDEERQKKDAARIRTEADLNLGGSRLLAVDDSKSIIAFYRSVIAKMGYQVTTAEDGKEAWQVIQHDQDFDLIIIDMNMPEMDGIELTRKIREMSGLDEIPIIMATTESDQLQRNIAMDAGVTDFITKPFTPQLLGEVIDENIE